MVTIDNFASKLYALLISENPNDEIKEWRLLGQEQDGVLLFSWDQSTKDDNPNTHIGFYHYEKNKLKSIYCFGKKVNCIQASVDGSRRFLAFVAKEQNDENQELYYKSYLHKIGSENDLFQLELEGTKQAMVQFLYPKQSVLSEAQPLTFLLMTHQENIVHYQIKNQNDVLSEENLTKETLVGGFIWAQWDPIHQTLYYIHYKKAKRGLIEGDEELPIEKDCKISPTLSGLQFHDELPHESVLNIPLNLPRASAFSNNCNIYEDDVLPLRIHDCTLDLIVITDSKGFFCVCHHYLYQPIQSENELDEDDESLIHMAYSVTVLHHSCVLHCVVPDIPWKKAKTLRPLFILHGEHLLVRIPEICAHILDVGLMHEPCCHITTKPFTENIEPEMLCLTPIRSIRANCAVNLATLDLVDVTIPTSLLKETFKSDTLVENKLSILHYLVLHSGDQDVASELISWQAEKPFLLSFPQMLREYLIGSSYAAVQRNLPSDAHKLVNLLPFTTLRIGSDLEIKIGGKLVSLSQDVLWNASMMLLSPQQRIVPYRSDIWVKLWDQLAKITKGKPRFKPSQVVEKLMISLVCYQPEILSRSSTPMSPSGSIGSASSLNDFINSQGSKRTQVDYLPFYEVETCTASKQEHIISVNLRELSMYLLKQSSDNRVSRFQWQLQTPIHVHAVATRYITAQLDQSRQLCQILCKAATYDPRCEIDKGFVYISQTSEEKRYILFTILERYYLALESIAFPLPQGFTSFFTFLGYKTLTFDLFLQYVNRNVFELQVDVMKIIMGDIDNSKTGIERKLQLLRLLPRSRAKRLLNQWHYPVSLTIRAREHSSNILSGVVNLPTGKNSQGMEKKGIRGISAFPTGDQMSPLDSFLDLLTAKASLNDIDFGLLIEASEVCNKNIS
ncbi:protein pigeon [Cylas formicarius]|uniref:protein pigeon n=1 Tax=Cylas formicarius TaxID=197179 RepID=UPI00295846E0|nr:protein pigeon [Cylas formicarius]